MVNKVTFVGFRGAIAPLDPPLILFQASDVFVVWTFAFTEAAKKRITEFGQKWQGYAFEIM